VAKQQGVRWVNDSKATNVGACIAAIEGLAKNKNIILIAGGVAKEQAFSDLTPVLEQYVKAIALLGQDAAVIAENVPKTTQKNHVTDMADAIHYAKSKADDGDIVLLSPACASFDMYSSYVERGESFIQAVEDALT